MFKTFTCNPLNRKTPPFFLSNDVLVNVSMVMAFRPATWNLNLAPSPDNCPEKMYRKILCISGKEWKILWKREKSGILLRSHKNL